MDAVAGAVEADPRQADRIVGAGGNAQFLADRGGGGVFGKQLGIERVVRIFGPDFHAQRFADGPLGLVGGDGAGKLGDEQSVGVVGAQGLFREADFDLGEGRQGLGLDGGHGDDRPGGRIGPREVRIQAAQGRAVDVEFFGEHFFDAGVAHARQFRAFEPRGGMGRERRVVGRGDGGGGQHAVGVAEFRDESGVDLAGGEPLVFLLPGGERLFALGAPAAVDAAGGEVVAVEPRLDGEEHVDRRWRRRGRLRRQRPGDGRRRLRRGCRRGRGPRRRERRLERHNDAAGERQPENRGGEVAESGAHVHPENMADGPAQDNRKAASGSKWASRASSRRCGAS